MTAELSNLRAELPRLVARASAGATSSKAVKILDAADDFIKAALTTAGVIGGAGLVGFGLEMAGVAGAGQVAGVGGLVTGGLALWARCAIEMVEGLTVNVNLQVPERLAAHTLRFMAEQMDKSADRVIVASGAGIAAQPDARLADDLVKFLEKGDEVGFSIRSLAGTVLSNGTRVSGDRWREWSGILADANVLIKDKSGTRLAIPLDAAIGLIRHPALSE